MKKILILSLFVFSFLLFDSCSLIFKHKKEKIADVTEWVNPEPCTDSYIPKEDDFVPVEKEPYVDLNELAKKVIYPKDARKDEVEGKVMLRVLVDSKGIVRKIIKQFSPDPRLTIQAMDAVRKTNFTPAINKSKPVACWITIPIMFKLK